MRACATAIAIMAFATLVSSVGAAEKATREQLVPRLVAAVQEMLSQGENAKVWVSLLGKPQELKVRGADEKNLLVDVQGNGFPLAWAKFNDRELLAVAKGIGGSHGARLLLAAEVAVATGADEDASMLLARAKEADPNLGERLAAIAGLLPQAAPVHEPVKAKPIGALEASGLSAAKSNARPGQPAAAPGAADESPASVSSTLPLSGGAPARALTPSQTAGPKDYLGKINKLKPGEVLLLQAGTYTKDLQLHGLNGTQDRPIVIMGPPSGPRAVFVANGSHNTVELRDCSFVEVRNLELDGKGLGSPFGVSAKDGKVHDITIDGLYIHDYNGSQQTDGISTKVPTWNWTIRNNVIERAGTGMYLGNSSGSDPFVNGLIEHNLIVDTTGYNIQIKHQNSRPEIPGIERGVTIIRHNVFVKSKWYEKNDGARPNLLVGHPPESGPGSDDLFLIYGNFFWKNPREALFQGEGHIAFFNNVCVNPDNAGVRLTRHNGKVLTAAVFNNTVVAKGAGIAVSGGDKNFPQFVTGNAVFGGGCKGPNAAENVTGSYEDAAKFLVNPFGGPGELNCFPLPGKLRGQPVDVSRYKDYLEALKDFNGNIHDGTWRGAYAGEGANPGWIFDQAKKTLGTAEKK